MPDPIAAHTGPLYIAGIDAETGERFDAPVTLDELAAGFAGTSTPAEGGILGDVAAALDFVESDGYSPARKRWRSWLARPSTSTSGTKPRPVYLKVSEGL